MKTFAITGVGGVASHDLLIPLLTYSIIVSTAVFYYSGIYYFIIFLVSDGRLSDFPHLRPESDRRQWPSFHVDAADCNIG